MIQGIWRGRTGTAMLRRRTWAAGGMLLLVMACGGTREPAVSSSEPGAAAGSTTADSAVTAAPDESRKLARFVYIEEGTDLILTVGVRAAALHEEDPYFPLEVSLTNKMKGVTWVLTRESFRLRDEAGAYYEIPSQAVLAEGYGKRTLDTRLFEARSVTASKHEAYRQVESNFFPDPVAGVNPEPDTVSGGSGVAPTSTSLIPIERVEVAPKTFMEDVLYFPHPEELLLGQRLTLEITSPGLEEPALLVFRVPHIR
jgi:hypothetical protein